MARHRRQSNEQQPATRPSRKRKFVSYIDDDSDFDLERPTTNESTRPARQSQRVLTYAEQDTSDEDLEIESDRGSTPEDSLAVKSSSRSHPASIPKSVRAVLPSRGERQRTDRKTMFSEFKRRKHNHTPASAKNQMHDIPGPSNGKTIHWSGLEYQILFKIFKFAVDSMMETSSSSRERFLVGTSGLCKSFYDASMAVLLYSPTLLPSSRAHGILRLLRRDPETLKTNPHPKIRRLDIDVKHLLLQKSGISVLDLSDLIRFSPRLSSLRFIHPHDEMPVWAQRGHQKGRAWAYPEAVFDTMDEVSSGCLQEFEWNGRFPGTIEVISRMLQVHSRKSFHSVRYLHLRNLNLPERAGDLEKTRLASDLVTALAKLPLLTRLEFRNCNIADDFLLPHLQTDLERLSFVRCPLTSDSLEALLSSNGHSLKELNLAGNQNMHLGFMSKLSLLCPTLQYLLIDLTYFDPSSFRDVHPHFLRLFPCGTPTWPSTLREIDMANLRNLSLSELDSFLNSLVSSQNLQSLRTLSIKAMPEGNWRDRANARLKWQNIFSRVYQPCTDELPRPASQPLRSRRAVPSEAERRPSEYGSIGPTQLALEKRCNVRATLTIDNQRPSELQYNDSDFLDDELSGDEEYRG